MKIEWDNEDLSLDQAAITGTRMGLPSGDKVDVDVTRGVVCVDSKYGDVTICRMPVRDLFVIAEYVMDMLSEEVVAPPHRDLP